MAAFMDIFPDFNIAETRHQAMILNYEDRKFYNLYRFNKDSFSFIVELVRSQVESSSSSLSCEIQVAAALRYYASGCFQTDVGEGLRISQPSVHRSILNVGRALQLKMDDFIQWPDREIMRRNQIDFHRIANFPNVFGAIDCTHIRIMRPSVDENNYVNRKFYHSLNVQAICGPRGLLHNVDVHWPGSSHDSFILRQSEVWNVMENASSNGIILGDSAYPVRPWLLTPLSNPRTPSEISYNISHKKTRVIIEHTFGRLKRRFHLLHSENRRRSIEGVVTDISACCVLHNVAILRNQDVIEYNLRNDEQPDSQFYDGPMNNQQRRQQIISDYF